MDKTPKTTIQQKLELISDTAAEAVNAGEMELAMLTGAIGICAMLAEIAQEISRTAEILENPVQAQADELTLSLTGV